MPTASAGDRQHHHRAEALGGSPRQRSKLDLQQILASVVDHAAVLFGGDRAAVFLRRPDGHVTAEVARGLSDEYLAALRDFQVPSLPAEAAAARRPLFATHYRDDPRAVDVRSAVVQEGFDTICAAPLSDGDELLGLLIVYHDRPHSGPTRCWATPPRRLRRRPRRPSKRQNYERMATWAAQTSRSSSSGRGSPGPTTEKEIGAAIANDSTS